MAEVINITRKSEGRSTVFANAPTKTITTEMVRDWFVEAGAKSKRLAVPSDAECATVAEKITELSRPHRDAEPFSMGAEKVQLEKLLVVLAKRARTFRSFGDTALAGTPLADVVPVSLMLIEAITVALNNNDQVKAFDPVKHTWETDAQRIALAAHRAWSSCCKKAPVSSRGPMATFVYLALNALGRGGKGLVAIDKALRPPKK